MSARGGVGGDTGAKGEVGEVGESADKGVEGETGLRRELWPLRVPVLEETRCLVKRMKKSGSASTINCLSWSSLCSFVRTTMSTTCDKKSTPQ